MQQELRNLAGVALIGVFLYGAGLAEQTSSSRDVANAGRGVYTDDLQRSTTVFTFH